MTCDHCGRQMPEGVFCSACGAHQGTTRSVGDAPRRLHRYAAHPGEHVASPNLFTTILPHLASHKVHEFRYAFLAGMALLAVLYATGIVIGAIIVAAILVPSLYLVYLYEAQVYRHEPVAVIGVTVGGGVVLGTVMTLVVNHIFTPRVTGDGYSTSSSFVVATVVIPLIQLALMVLPALALRSSGAFGETADGLVFGIAAGLGFAGAETIVRFSNTLGTLPVRTDPANWIFPLISIAVLVPLVHGCSAGAVVASLWPGKGRYSRRMAGLGIPAAVLATVSFYVVDQVLADHGVSRLVRLGWQAGVVGALVVFIRFLLHHALLDEAQDLGLSTQVCANCHRHVVAAGFCPACGMALRAAPRTPGMDVAVGAEQPAVGAV